MYPRSYLARLSRKQLYELIDDLLSQIDLLDSENEELSSYCERDYVDPQYVIYLEDQLRRKELFDGSQEAF